MPELVELKAAHYACVIWSKDVSTSRIRLAKTLEARKKKLPESRVLLSPPLALGGAIDPVPEHPLGPACFFENRQYEIEFVFAGSLKSGFETAPPRMEHSLKAVEDAFHYSSRSNSLRGTFNTGNDVGWFRIVLVYTSAQEQIRQSFAFEILPTKMDMETDLETMGAQIDEAFPLWRFSLAEKTFQQAQSVRQPHPQFLLLWLAQFESLWSDMARGLKHIVNAPHSRLLATRHSIKMDKLKGRLSPRLEQGVANAKADKNTDKRFEIEKKQLSVDTPENRFIKAVIATSSAKLGRIIQLVEKNRTEPEKQRLSDSFYKKLEQWQGGLQRFHRDPLFREVGSFNGLTTESLVLQLKPGYAKVYRIWQQLKWHLALLEGQANLSLRSVSELYEVWCFLEVLRILGELGFEEITSKPVPLVNSGLDVSFRDGMQGSFHLERADGVKIRLAHEPEFHKRSLGVRSWTTSQKPDIYLEATFPDNKVFVWVFDAKYRIKAPDDGNNTPSGDIDLVPEDAINQMHRYRDALIHQNKLPSGHLEKSRPVYGAYALYPGFFDQESQANPYSESIEQIGIGAFALLPGNGNKGSLWLTGFLEEKLNRDQSTYPLSASEKLFVGEAPRIPYNGTTVSRFNDLAIVASQLGPGRNQPYTEKFLQGKATHYHTRALAFERQSIEHHIVLEARYLAVALDTGNGTTREISCIYPILNAEKLKRTALTEEITGISVYPNPDELYWLFTLGNSLQLQKPVIQQIRPGFKIKLTGAEDLSGCQDWDSLEERYTLLAT